MVSLNINLHDLVNEAFQGFAESGIVAMQAGGSPDLRQAALKEAARSFGKQMATQHSGTFVAARYNLTKIQRVTLLEEQSLPDEFVDHAGLADINRVGQVLAFVSDLENMHLGAKAQLLENIFIHQSLLFDNNNDQQLYYNLFFNLSADKLMSNMSKATKNRDITIKEIELLNDEFAIDPETLFNHEEGVLERYHEDKNSSFRDLFVSILRNFSSSDKTQKKHYMQMVRNMQAMAINYSMRASEHHRDSIKS
jgi:hypothetical protein